jgi:hypothetical protein
MTHTPPLLKLILPRRIYEFSYSAGQSCGKNLRGVLIKIENNDKDQAFMLSLFKRR